MVSKLSLYPCTKRRLHTAMKLPRRRVLFLAGGSLVACGKPQMPKSTSHPLLGRSLPSFRRPTVQGGRFDLNETEGRIVVVKFFAKYCKPCVRTLPATEDLHRTHGPHVVVLGIAEDEYRSDVMEVIGKHGLSFPVIHDRGNVLAGRFRMSKLPSTYVSDRERQVRWVGVGELGAEDAHTAVKALI